MKNANRVITITVGILLLLTLIVLMYFRGDFTSDDMNDILAKTASVDICRNMDFDNEKLLSCDDENNEIVLSIGKSDDKYELVNNMYTNAKEVNIILDSIKAQLKYGVHYYYKAIFKDENGNIIAGATLGCDKNSFIKVDDTVYKINHPSACEKNYKILYSYLKDNDAGLDNAIKKYEESMN